MTADFLNEIKGAFGIKALTVESQGATILKQGEFSQGKSYFDGKIRAYR